ncbi:MAG: NAD-dependent epimerase/dehydratase family protein [Acetatifactor sp.]|nr:NAD-dependent epimerase/dehydratase family protein [Acetatifactor sp.]
MKKVLITGANSYIGTSFEKWVVQSGANLDIDTIDMIGEAWKNFDFYKYDSVFHVAGIAHADVGKVTEEQKKLYYAVNTDLTIACAQKAKSEGVKQFIYMSSIIVYGESAHIGKKKIITRDTPLSPANFYGDSKVKAEEGLRKLEDGFFKVVILRPPMIYGKGSKGNYPLLSKMAVKFPLFPDVQNERSMLYVENLCKFVSLMILNEECGVFFPQNAEYVRTSQMVFLIAASHGKKVHLTRIFAPILFLFGHFGGKIGGLVNKAFGNLVYEKSISQYREQYHLYDLEESIRVTEHV